MNETVNFELRKENNIAIFKLLEKNFDAQIAGLVKGELTILLTADEINKLVFDLSEVEYCDSSGLSAILLAFRILQANEGHVRLAAPNKSVENLINISQLSRVLPICNSVEEAVKELEKL
ncbi:anti-sigma-B factor antagonist [bacterium BMS3Abin04]|nr:anti-sigma-B factor antagonist [bacterium BMS3Abin04]